MARIAIKHTAEEPRELLAMSPEAVSSLREGTESRTIDAVSALEE